MAKDETLNTVVLVGGLLLIVDQIADALFPGRTAPGPDDLDTTGATLSESQLNVMAQACEQALLGGWGEDEETLYAQFAQLNTIGDLFGLIKAYGERCALFGILWCGTLPATLGYYLDRDELDHINGILHDNGINFSF